MKRICLMYLFIIIGTLTYAGDRNKPEAGTKLVSGKVIDKISGEEIAGAEIRLANNVTVFTDLNGNFSAFIAEAKSTAVVHSISYSETKITIDPFSYSTLIIELEPR